MTSFPSCSDISSFLFTETSNLSLKLHHSMTLKIKPVSYEYNYGSMRSKDDGHYSLIGALFRLLLRAYVNKVMPMTLCTIKGKLNFQLVLLP